MRLLELPLRAYRRRYDCGSVSNLAADRLEDALTHSNIRELHKSITPTTLARAIFRNHDLSDSFALSNVDSNLPIDPT